MSRTDRQLEEANERMARIEVVFADRMHRLRDTLAGMPGAQSFEPRTGSAVVHCWVHERDVRDCREVDLDCDGETIEVHDPTGETAIRPDRARADLRRIQSLLARHERTSIELEDLMARYDGRITDERRGMGTCTDCRRYFNGTRDERVSAYKGSADTVCTACRSRRDRRKAGEPCPSVLTHDCVEHTCELTVEHGGRHRGGGYTWARQEMQVSA